MSMASSTAQNAGNYAAARDGESNSLLWIALGVGVVLVLVAIILKNK